MTSQDRDRPHTLYPRTMAYFIAQQMTFWKPRGEISSMLLRAHNSGKLKALAAKGWRPK